MGGDYLCFTFTRSLAAQGSLPHNVHESRASPLADSHHENAARGATEGDGCDPVQ